MSSHNLFFHIDTIHVSLNTLTIIFCELFTTLFVKFSLPKSFFFFSYVLESRARSLLYMANTLAFYNSHLVTISIQF